MRQVILDTETTGLDPASGHRIIEIGCIELINRRITSNHFHQYLNPERAIDAGAQQVHGLSTAFLADKPTFSEIAERLYDYLDGAEVIIHNAPFDVAFLDHELDLCASSVKVNALCSVTDSLALARKMYPGQRNSLDALCKRYGVDNSSRTLHGALLDSEILADVYLLMTGGQTSFSLAGQGGEDGDSDEQGGIRRLSGDRPPLNVIQASNEELELHREKLDAVEKVAGSCLWRSVWPEQS